jgi:hypothetical protein
MAKTTKPTKQQAAQAKARAGGNNPVKVTNAGLKKLGGAALIAASMTPAGRGAKIAVTAAKAVKAAKAAKATVAAPKSAVNVVKAQGKSYNKVANQKEADRLARTARPKTASSKDLRGTAKQDYEVAKIPVTKNVTARVPAKSNYEFAKDMTRFEKIRKQSLAPAKLTKVEAKANARGLKAAQKPIKEKATKKMTRQELNDSIKKQLSNRREQDKRNYPKK